MNGSFKRNKYIGKSFLIDSLPVKTETVEFLSAEKENEVQIRLVSSSLHKKILVNMLILAYWQYLLTWKDDLNGQVSVI